MGYNPADLVTTMTYLGGNGGQELLGFGRRRIGDVGVGEAARQGRRSFMIWGWKPGEVDGGRVLGWRRQRRTTKVVTTVGRDSGRILIVIRQGDDSRSGRRRQRLARACGWWGRNAREASREG